MSKIERFFSSLILILMIPLVLGACDNGRRAGIAAPDDGIVPPPAAEESPASHVLDRYKTRPAN